ncbi:MAG: DUF4388 domain-containing protein [Chitinivibrionia bacterium]|nr:DUF4388 domain-containing protein [Chitinivibrionia bacterium]
MARHIELFLSAALVFLLFSSPVTRAILNRLPHRTPLSGSLSRFSIGEVLALVSSHARTGVLVVKGPAISGTIHFDCGEARHCETKNLKGHEALRAILKRASSGTFYFRETNPPRLRTIDTPLSLIIMDLSERASAPAPESAPKRPKSKVSELLESR